MTGLIVFLVVAVPLLIFFGWLMLSSSFVRIEPGKLGLVIVRGRATDHALLPGPHFVPTFRRMMVQEYPSNELSYRAGDPEISDADLSELERAGPPLQVMLGDRARLQLGCTIRFRLAPDQLRSIHERFSADGVWAAVRDQSSRTIRNRLSDPELGVDDLFGPAREELEMALAAALGEALAADGFVLTLFSLGDLDLGRTGEVIQATVRARHDLALEEAEAATRQARARIDAALEPHLANAPSDAALRYREVEVWRDLAQARTDRGGVAMPAPTRPGAGTAPSAEPDAASSGDSSEP